MDNDASNGYCYPPYEQLGPGPNCSKPDLANPGLVEILIAIYLPLYARFFTRLRFKEKKFVIYDLIGSQFCGKSSFSGK